MVSEPSLRVISDVEALAVLDAFELCGAVVRCVRLTGGHINHSWKVSARQPDGDECRFTLQRLNPTVFPDGQAVMQNIVDITGRVAQRLDGTSRRGLRLVRLANGARWHTAPDGSVWRVYEFIDGVSVHEVAGTAQMAEATARAFGEFARMASDPPLQLNEVIPGFHDTRARLRQLEAAMTRDAAGRVPSVAGECRRILAESELAARIPRALENGEIPLRVAHNDAKIANVLFADSTDQPECIIDLDTVMPGTPLHDFGDLVRSMVSATPEDGGGELQVELRPGCLAAITRGYLDGTADLLEGAEQALLLDAARSVVLEQASRFLTDYLDGDVYYQVQDPGQNLRRGRTQLALFDALTHST